jgi:putative nucleotidyltransferase
MIIEYAKSLVIPEDEYEKWFSRINRIKNKLDEHYYSGDTKDSIVIVGSVGRLTAITKTSDYDVLYILPDEIFKRFNKYEEKGQSALLQDVKSIVKETYDKTDIRADGQVIDIMLKDGTIELVPAFKQQDGSFIYPDSNNGGKWKYTRPLEEIQLAMRAKDNSSFLYNYLCFLLRKWKNYKGFVFKGLLIDTLVFNYLNNVNYNNLSEFNLLKGLYEYIAKEDREKSYWLALGSNQKISNDDHGKFIYKASQALKEIDSSDDIQTVMKTLFGYNQYKNRASKEEFAEEKFIVDIQYNISMDCIITQDGYRPKKLSDYLRNGWKLKNNKTLTFSVIKSNIPKELPIKYYWKVRNIGPESIGRERGNIFKDKKTRVEHSDFNGPHFVECFAVVENIVIARDRISVPIDIKNGF